MSRALATRPATAIQPNLRPTCPRPTCPRPTCAAPRSSSAPDPSAAAARPLHALIAVFAPLDAERLLSFLSAVSTPGELDAAAALARAPRAERLAALASALGPGPAAEDGVSCEPFHPLLRRLLAESRPCPASGPHQETRVRREDLPAEPPSRG